MSASHALTLTVQFVIGPEFAQHKALLSRTALRRWVKAAQMADAELTLRFVEADEGQELNRTYRGKDYATNVLTFAYAQSEDDPVSGDIILCCPVVAREAAEQGKTLEEHYAHLIVHGVLHAQGYDHEEDDEAEEMEGIETDILAELGYADPYASEKAPVKVAVKAPAKSAATPLKPAKPPKAAAPVKAAKATPTKAPSEKSAKVAKTAKPARPSRLCPPRPADPAPRAPDRHCYRMDRPQDRPHRASPSTETPASAGPTCGAYPPDLGAAHHLTPDELSTSLDAALSLHGWDGKQDLWLFAYGSLIWNPSVPVEESCHARIYGYHRGLYLWSRVNRGTVAHPGLVLALDRGGSCAGVALRLAGATAREHLESLWHREMAMGSYRPAWLNCVLDDGRTAQGLAFVMRRDVRSYAGRLPDEIIRQVFDTAQGRYGTTRDYVARTVVALREAGMPDPALEAILHRCCAENPKD